MKTNKTIYTLLAAAALSLTACNDSDDWNPGPELPEDSPAIYFSSENPGDIEFEDYDIKSINLTLLRNNSDAAIDVPLTLEAGDVNFKLPQTVHFDAGQKQVNAVLDCEGIPAGQSFKIKVSIPAQYADTYGAGSTVYEANVMVVAWEELCPVTYTYNVNSSWLSTEPQGKLMAQTGTDKLRLTNFAGSGVDLMFRLDATTGGASASEPDIVPYHNVEYIDNDEYGSWYFFDQAIGDYPVWSIDSYTVSLFTVYREGYSNFSWTDQAARKGSMVFTGYLDFEDGSFAWSYIYADFTLPEGVNLPVKGI